MRPDTLVITDNIQNQNLNNGKIYALFLSPESTIDSVRKIPADSWKPFDPALPAPKGKAYWLHFYIRNESQTDSTLYFSSYNVDRSHFYVIIDNKLTTRQSGSLVKGEGSFEDDLGYHSFKLPFRHTAEVYIRISPDPGAFPFTRIMPMARAKPYFTFGNGAKKRQNQLRYFENNIYELQIRNIYQGALLLVSLVSLFFFLQNKKQKIYLYYFLYVNCALFYSLFQSRGYTYVGQFFLNWPYFKKFGGEICLWLGAAAYFGFASHLLDIPSQKPVFYQRLRYVMLGGVGFSLLYYFYQWGHNDNLFQDWVKIYTRIPLIVFYVWFLWYVFRNSRSPFLLYLFIGNLLMLILACIAWIKDIQNGAPWPGILNNLFTLPLAVLSEIIVFSFALVNKQKLDDKEKTEMERKVAETEMLALRSQMNPHFIFNSLSSIRNLVIKDQREKAIDYLSRFSKLVRLILQQTRRKTISLSEEIELLQLYIRSESDRLDRPIDFTIEEDLEQDLDDMLFPPMLLQPAAENAIWHGLQPSEKGEKRIRLIIKQITPTHLKIILEDNGIGRKRAHEIKSKENYERVSLGYEITSRRLELFNQNNRQQIYLLIEDLPNDGGTAVIFNYYL